MIFKEEHGVSLAGPSRVCICRGPWQVITLAASLETHLSRVKGAADLQTVLALSGRKVSGEMRQTMEDLAQQLGIAQRILWINDIVIGIASISDNDFAMRMKLLKDRIAVGKVTELWTASPNEHEDRFLFECYPRSRVIIYEDGLHTYSGPWAVGNPSASARIKATAKMLLRPFRADPSLRVNSFRQGIRLLGQRSWKPERAYLILANRLGVPKPFGDVADLVDTSSLRAVVQQFDVEANASLKAATKPRALVLSGCYSLFRSMSREEEVGLYAQVIAKLARSGYQILWKDHPKVLESFLPDLRRRSSKVDIQYYAPDDTWPLELYLQRDPVDLVVAGTSTSLLYIPLIFEERVQVGTFSEVIRPFVTGHRLNMISIVRSHVRSLDEIIENERFEDKAAAPHSDLASQESLPSV